MVLVVLSGFSVGSGVAFGLRTFSPTLDNSILSKIILPFLAFASSSAAVIAFVSEALLLKPPFSPAWNVTQPILAIVTGFPLFLNSESGILILCHSPFVSALSL